MSANTELRCAQHSVVIPCFNEEGNVDSLIKEARAIVARNPSIEFIFVDNGSTDETRKLLGVLTANTGGLKVIVVPHNQGYGFGIRSGLRGASGKFVGWTHADHQTKLTDVEAAVNTLEHTRERVFLKGRRTGRPLADNIFTVGMSLIESILFRTSLIDINAQPTLFSREILGEVLDGPDDFSLDLFAYVQAKKSGMKIVRIPVTFGPRFAGKSKWNTSLKSRVIFIQRTLAFSLKLAFSKKGT